MTGNGCRKCSRWRVRQWVVDVGRGLLAAKPELRYWAMPLCGFAKGDSPAAIAQAAQRPSGLPNTERPKLSRSSLSHLREPERRPDALAFGKYEAIFREMLDFWWAAPPHISSSPRFVKRGLCHGGVQQARQGVGPWA
jgi:hypothetical protein